MTGFDVVVSISFLGSTVSTVHDLQELEGAYEVDILSFHAVIAL